MTYQVRQGDVLLTPSRHTEKQIKAIAELHHEGSAILAYGEATGHHHKIEQNARVYKGEALVQLALDEGVITDRDGLNPLDLMWIVVDEPTTLTHQEHDAIEILPNTYWKVPQRQYTPQAVQRVQD